MTNRYSGVFINDGLPAKEAQLRYQARRKTLSQAFPHPILVMGVPEGPNRNYPWAHLHSFIFQDPSFLYLTGINQPKTGLFITPTQETLFIEPKSPHLEFWDGTRLGIGNEIYEKELQDVSGFTRASNIKNWIDTVINWYLKNPKQKTLGLFWNENKKGKILKDNHWAVKTKLARAFKRKKLAISIVNIAPYLSNRLELDSVDQDNLLIANQKTAEAFKETLTHLPQCLTENELAGCLNGAIQKQSYFGNSFTSIVASGTNATTLHYTKNNSPLIKGQLVLLDFGVRWHSMNADISRTVPISGPFNPLQTLLYTLVLDTQAWVEKHAKAGVTINELNKLCWTFLNEALEKRFVALGGKIKLDYSFSPHNVGHLLGLQVHDGDPFRDYRDTPLKADMVITNEPGLYGHFEITLEGEKFSETIGIRIEDNLLITQNGCKNLSTSCPKSIKELEKLMGKRD